jgi:UDPglucose 6-dehydrogenase
VDTVETQSHLTTIQQNDPRLRRHVAVDVAVIGAGCVGLTTAACLAHLGHRVRCSDIDAERVARLAAGELDFVEEGLDQLVQEHVALGSLSFGRDNAWAVGNAEFTFLCLPTPETPDGRPDLVEHVVTEIGPHLVQDSILVTRSTVPVGSTEVIQRLLGRPDVAVVSNPEFLREGAAVEDFLQPHRVVIGSDDEGAAMRLASIFSPLSAPLIITDPRTAEMTKYAANAFLATKVSFVNAIAALCDVVGADIRQVTRGLGLDPRIGPAFLTPGPGWGGPCLAKDIASLVRTAEGAGVDFSLLREAVAINEKQVGRVVDKVLHLAGGSIAERRVAMWGVTFKAGTSDRRHSPAVELAARFANLGASVSVYDPTLGSSLSGMHIAADPYAACDGAAVLVVATEWPEFQTLDFDKVGMLMKHRCVVDARNLLDPVAMKRAGFAYEGIGIP